LGLAEDYGIVLYQESRSHPHLSLREIRLAASPGICWSMVTTAGAFLLLNLSGLPGLGQLGTLVAIGVALAAAVMLYAYLPPLLGSEHRSPVQRGETSIANVRQESGVARRNNTPAWLLTMLFVSAGATLLWLKPPRFDQSPDALRPRISPAYDALGEIKLRLDQSREPLWVIVRGVGETEVARRLSAVELLLKAAVSNGVVAGFTLPTALWPQVAHQEANRAAALALTAREGELQAAILGAGFTSNSTSLTEAMLQQWNRAAVDAAVFWPTNLNSRWVLEKMTARTTDEFLAVGLIHPTDRGVPGSFAELSTLGDRLQTEGAWLSGWALLGPAVSKLVLSDLGRVLPPILGLVFVTLWLAFRSGRDVWLSFLTLVVSGIALHLVMVATGWIWNMMNLMALPLLLGMSVDYSIHIQLALRRHRGDTDFVRRSVGRALLLAGSTTVAGFASLSFASNAGIAGLGKVCAAGVVCSMLTSVYLLPHWWRMSTRENPGAPAT
jgi:predicted exporter